MTVDQWNKLAAFIKSEARAASSYIDKEARLIREQREAEAKFAFLQGEEDDGL